MDKTPAKNDFVTAHPVATAFLMAVGPRAIRSILKSDNPFYLPERLPLPRRYPELSEFLNAVAEDPNYSDGTEKTARYRERHIKMLADNPAYQAAFNSYAAIRKPFDAAASRVFGLDKKRGNFFVAAAKGAALVPVVHYTKQPLFEFFEPS